MKKKFFLPATFILIFCVYSFPRIVTATVGESCCQKYTGARRQKYNIETDKCDHYVLGVKAEEYDILCERPLEKCQENGLDELGTCVFTNPHITPTPTETPSYPEPGFCNIEPYSFDEIGFYDITITNSEIKKDISYSVVTPDGAVVEVKSKTNGKIVFKYYLGPTEKGGQILVREYNLGRKLICTGLIKTSNDKKIDPTCNSGQGIDTAIGCIPTSSLNAFAGWILGKIVFIASGIAFLLMAFGAFQIITSSGDPKKTQAGKELITSALSGLLFIILSIFLLKLIGVDILKIPGFG
ncbi:hypothetical protein COS55_02430 [Candidatus Shapirobacteria bacterium CG03_land_8_20_14_0_80_40_19]|uniref:Uncharacterized protein n=1 Tax=Candidatus Shapirobacteria bacterium CG03_land_8_20_14_0_80_40_19 TaxID=1974880 RepID=A0A2M7BDI6_9BACT|nr:MAG: hypothetical protein COS55_02430 [Candidatus Shapirobacteria bacterium CG03_land_8_20_14_0_80_40_19]